MSLIYSENEDGIIPVFWALITSYPIVVLTMSVNSFHSETHRTVEIVYDIMEKHAVNGDVEYELHNFAVELLHRNVSFDAFGFFSLDCTLLKSIFGMITTYILILVQFRSTDDADQ
ncbi:gustatory receptor 68a-like [Fopius arisanus]|uniref:Gustatory receptor 68a-like n=1 Tax=Fopius arisanus TaxID=64838 RepID=A0A9R1TKI5_9HYME|nr:PREDICTED: gustatory receptor 68a-like [Fopius arisanus]